MQKRMKAYEMYNLNGYYHAKCFYLDKNGTIKTSIGYDNTVMSCIEDVCFHYCHSWKTFIAECRKNGIVISRKVIANRF